MAKLSAAMILSIGVWFASSAATATSDVATAAPLQRALLLTALQAGFAFGTLGIALLGLADRVQPQNLFAGAAALACLSTLVLAFVHPSSAAAPIARLLTGIAMAGIYPAGMKLATTWSRGDLGLLVAIVVASLTLGSALPYLLAGIGTLSWQTIHVVASAGAMAGGLLALSIRSGMPTDPSTPRLPFRLGRGFSLLADRSRRLVTLAYCGHMWELYAMWGCLGHLLNASFSLSPDDGPHNSAVVAFLAIALGAAGCLVAGSLADRIGRSTVIIGCLIVSGASSACLIWAFDRPPFVVEIIAMIWGLSIVADSAQFSAGLVELTPKEFIGTALTMQTCIGFCTSLVTVYGLPLAAEMWGWRASIGLLLLGPIVGVTAIGALAHSNGAASAARSANRRSF
jgi:MFS family permease